MHWAQLKFWTGGLLPGWKHGGVAKDRQSLPPQSAALQIRREFNEKERAFMLELARRSVASAAFVSAPPEARDVPERLRAKRACFVTLTRGGELRGCVGQLIAQDPLYQSIVHNSVGAALRDPRFPALQPAELPGLQIEISVLTPLQPLRAHSPEELLDRLQPHQDGVVLQLGDRFATFLPQVWEKVPGKRDFLERLAEKAGCPRGAWHAPDARLSVYQAECFQTS